MLLLCLLQHFLRKEAEMRQMGRVAVKGLFILSSVASPSSSSSVNPLIQILKPNNRPVRDGSSAEVLTV